MNLRDLDFYEKRETIKKAGMKFSVRENGILIAAFMTQTEAENFIAEQKSEKEYDIEELISYSPNLVDITPEEDDENPSIYPDHDYGAIRD